MNSQEDQTPHKTEYRKCMQNTACCIKDKNRILVIEGFLDIVSKSINKYSDLEPEIITEYNTYQCFSFYIRTKKIVIGNRCKYPFSLNWIDIIFSEDPYETHKIDTKYRQCIDTIKTKISINDIEYLKKIIDKTKIKENKTLNFRLKYNHPEDSINAIKTISLFNNRQKIGYQTYGTIFV